MSQATRILTQKINSKLDYLLDKPSSSLYISSNSIESSSSFREPGREHFEFKSIRESVHKHAREFSYRTCSLAYLRIGSRSFLLNYYLLQTIYLSTS